MRITFSRLIGSGLVSHVCALALVIVSQACVAQPQPDGKVHGGPPAGTAMVPTFAEEFNGNEIDRSRWNLAYGPRIAGEAPVGSRSLWSNGEAQIYFDRNYLHLGIDPFAVHNGMLTISARPLPAAAQTAIMAQARQQFDFSTFKQPPRIEYSSGAITTRDLFAQRYGYFEIRAAWSGGKGVWPAFWLLPANGAWPPEIDVIEAHGDKDGVAFQSMHSGQIPSITKTPQVSGSQHDLHTYGVLWSPGKLDFYIDGQQTVTEPEPPDMNQPMYLLANMAIGGFWPGYPDPGGAFAATMTIDYIRVWQFRKNPKGAPVVAP